MFSTNLFLSTVYTDLKLRVVCKEKITHVFVIFKRNMEPVFSTDVLSIAIGWLVIVIYLSSLPLARLSDSPERRLVVTGDSARIQDKTTENSAWFFNVLGV